MLDEGPSLPATVGSNSKYVCVSLTVDYSVRMAVWIRTENLGGRSPPELPGLEQQDGEWRLRADYYQQFVEDVTGVDLADGLSASELKTVQTRLEGCIETYEREGHCICDEFSRYGYVDSISTVHELARFFRVLVTTRVENPDAA